MLIDNANILFQNIMIDSLASPEAFEGTIDLCSNGKLWMRDCVIKTGECGIMAHRYSNLFIKDC